MLKIWFANFRLPPDAVRVSSAEELNSRYGDILPALAAQNPTAYRPTKVLKARTPPLIVSDEVLKHWFRRYFDAVPVNSAGHLELMYGDRIREDAEAVTLQAAELRVWLRTVLKVDASQQTCQTWRTRSWSTAGRLMSIHDIEHSIGDRLRLLQYRHQFGEDSYDNLAADLSEGQPSVYLADPFLLRQWYAKYHPDSGPLRISSAVELESLLGEDLRLHYADLNDWTPYCIATAHQARITHSPGDRYLDTAVSPRGGIAEAASGRNEATSRCDEAACCGAEHIG